MRRRLLGESVVYGLGSAVTQAVGVLLVPLYAHELGASGYGQLTVLMTTFGLMSAAAGLSLHQAFFRHYLGTDESHVGRRRVLATALFGRLVLSALAAIIVLALSLPLATALGAPDSWALFALLGPAVFAETLVTIPLSYLRAERRPAAYVAVVAVRAIVAASSAIWFVLVAGLGVLGALLGMLAGLIVGTVLSLVLLARSTRIALVWDRATLERMIAFSAPLVPATIAGWSLNFADRYVIQVIEGPAAVGVYAAGYAIGMLVNVAAITPFTLAFAPVKWELAKRDDGPAQFASVMATYVAVASVLALLASAAAPFAASVLLPAQFSESARVVPLIAFAYVAYGAYTIGSSGLIIRGRTATIAGTMVLAAVLTVGLTVPLVAALGAIGAAVATLIGYATLAVVTTAVSNAVYRVAWPTWSASLAIGTGVVLGSVIQFVEGLGPRAMLIAAFMVFLVAIRLIRPAELKQAVRGLARRASNV